MRITKEMLRKELYKKTDCDVQHEGFTCNTCFHAIQGLDLQRNIHDYWEAVLAFRGDYPELKKQPKLIEELYQALQPRNVYEITADNIEHILTQYVKARSVEEAKEKFLEHWENGDLAVVKSEIIFKEIKKENSKNA